MKIVKLQYMDELHSKRMAAFTKQYSFFYLDSVEKFQRNLRIIYIIGFVFFLPFLYVIVNPNIAPLVDETNTTLEIFMTIIALFLGTQVIIGIHELIHLVAFPRGWRKKYIVFKRPMIYAVYDGFVSKKRGLISLMAPFAIITSVLIISLFVFSFNMSVILALFITNSIASLQDIYVFFSSLKNAPKNSYSYGNAFTTDITKEKYKELMQP